jgi:hypothetical protein
MTRDQLERRNARRIKEQRMVLQDILRRQQAEKVRKCLEFWK